MKFAKDEQRYLHAKIFLFKSEKGVFCLTGSCNATRPALLESFPSGNIEVAVLRYESDPNYYDYILSNPNLSIEGISFSDVLPSHYEDTRNYESTSLLLTQAYIESNQLRISL